MDTQSLSFCEALYRPKLSSFVQAVILNGDSSKLSVRDYSKKSPKLPVTEVILDEPVKCIERIRIPYQELHGGIDGRICHTCPGG
jgi:hypothetical protein